MSSSPASKKNQPLSTAASSNFLRSQIESDLARGNFAQRTWNGLPGVMKAGAATDPANIRTRFPPEPNGYLHIGHAKSICLNFSLARDYSGVCHMRFDDTNPAKEEQEYVDSILDSVQWLGFDWQPKYGEANGAHLYYASDYFEQLYRFAEYLIQTGHAYVDEQSSDAIRMTRGSLTEPGTNSPYRDRSPEASLERFRAMRRGEHAEGSMVLRAKIDMASPNINMRDPVLYRVRFAEHHRSGNAWCIYPMYDYTHCICDALENITHSICTLEFEDHRPLYDWTLERIVPLLRAPLFAQALEKIRALNQSGVEARKEFAVRCHNLKHKLFASAAEQQMLALFMQWEQNRNAILHDLDRFFDLLLTQSEQFTPLLAHALAEQLPNPFALPHQYEFARLNLSYVITSKRKLLQLVNEGHVHGWDDPRLSTLVGLRRRGYTPAALQLFCERIGVSKADSWIDYSVLEGALRDDLDSKAPRAVAVLNPVKLIIDNYPVDHSEICSAPVHPHHEAMGRREFPLSRELWIEAEDFNEHPPKGYFRLFPGNTVRLRYGYVVECVGCDKHADGRVIAVHVNYFPDSKSGTPGADTYKVKGNIHWVSVTHAVTAQVRLYDRLFLDAQPDSGGKDYLQCLNPDSQKTVSAYLEAGLNDAPVGARYQFERHGYFVVDQDSTDDQLVFNRIVTLKDSWGK